MRQRSAYLIAILCLLTGCTTYHITTQSLQAQLAGTPAEKKGNLLIPVDNIKGNALRQITVLDPKGKEKVLPVNYHTGVKITRKSGKHTTFYFDTLLLTDSTISGSKTHLFNARITPIPFA